MVLRITASLMVALPADDPFSLFTEWDSDADRKAYGDL